MKITYNNNGRAFFVKLECPETEIVLCTKDITEAKKEFLNRMENLFNNTICELLKEVS